LKGTAIHLSFGKNFLIRNLIFQWIIVNVRTWEDNIEKGLKNVMGGIGVTWLITLGGVGKRPWALKCLYFAPGH